MFKKALSFVLACILLFSVPAQALANQAEELLPQLSSGTNPFVPLKQTPLSEAEIKQIRDELAAKQKRPAGTPSAAQEPVLGTLEQQTLAPYANDLTLIENTRFRIYPITVKENGVYEFKGLFVGGKITDNAFVSLTYQLQSDEGAPAIVNDGDLAGTDKFPNSSMFDPGYDQYSGGTDNWQSSALLTNIQTDTLYRFVLQFDPEDPQAIRAPLNVAKAETSEDMDEDDGEDDSESNEDEGVGESGGDGESGEPGDNGEVVESGDDGEDGEPGEHGEAGAETGEDALEQAPQPTLESASLQSNVENKEITNADEENNNDKNNSNENNGEDDITTAPEPPEEDDELEEAPPDTLPTDEPIKPLNTLFSTPPLTSESFLLYTMRPGDTLLRVVGHYGVPLQTVIEDNFIEQEDTLLSPGDMLFLRNPVTDKPLSPPSSIQGEDAGYHLGYADSTQYAYNLVNMSTGNLYTKFVDVSFDEYEGFEISRYYNAQAATTASLFGFGFSTNLGERLCALSDSAYLLTLEDGKEIQLAHKSANIYESADGRYSLEALSDGFRLSDYKHYVRTFNAYGQLTGLTDKSGLSITLEYEPATQKLCAINTKSGARFGIVQGDHGMITSIEKPDGTVLHYVYDESSQLIEVVDESGYITSYAYDAQGRLIQETNALSKAIFAVTYDSQNRVTSYKDGGGNTTGFAYEDKVIRFTDGEGNKRLYESDSKNRLTSIRYEGVTGGEEEQRVYDERDRVVTLINRQGDTTVYTYNDEDDITSVVTNGHTIAVYAYDANGFISSYTDSNGNVTLYENDARGNNTKVTFPDGSEQVMDYDSRNRLISLTLPGGGEYTYGYTGDSTAVTTLTDANGNTTTSTHDAMNRLTSAVTQGGSVAYTYTPTGLLESRTIGGDTETYTYDAVGNNIGSTDPNGHASLFEYDDNGRLTKVTTGSGEQLSYEYDKNGNLIKETNGKGETSAYEYDALGNRTKETAADGSSTSFIYDGKNRVTKETDQDGATIEYRYHDTLDLVVWKKDKLDRVETYEYDKAGNLTKTVYPDGTEVTNTYDAMNRLMSVTDARGVVTSYEYDAKGKIVKQSDTTGRVSEYAYDGNSNLIKETNALGASVEYKYDAKNRLLEAKDAQGKASTYIYDESGQVLEEKDRAGSIKKYTYDKNGNIATMQDANGNLTTYEYDGSNRQILEKNHAGHVFAAVYDGAGNLANTVDPFGNVTTYEYDAKQRLVKKTDANGNITAHEYDADGNKTKLTRADGGEAVYTYNKLGWLTNHVSPAGLVTTYTHDNMGRVTQLEQADRITLFEYDNIGNLITQTDPEGNVTSYEYDAYSRLIRQEDASGNVRAYTYDVLNRVVSLTDAKGRTTKFTYDNADVLTTLERHDGKTQQFAADGNGRLTAFTDELGHVTKYDYDGNGNLKTLTDPIGKSTAWAYDHNNLPLTETDRRGNAYSSAYDAMGRLTETLSPEGMRTAYYYDKTGNLTAVEDGAGNLSSFAYDAMNQCVGFTDAYGNTTAYTYNPDGFITESKAPDGGVTAYEYDAFGNNTEIRYPNGTSAAFTYDKIDRLLTETSAGGVTTTYDYDARGNLIKAADSTGRSLLYAYDAFNLLTKETNLLGGTAEYAYDAFDRVTGMTTDQGASLAYSYDAIGRLVESTDARGKVTAYTYDANGNALTVQDGQRLYSYAYDENGNLTSRTLPNGLTQTYRYDKDNRVAAQSDFKGAETTYAYNALSLTSSVTDRMGNTTAYEYDSLGNIAVETSADGAKSLFAYDIMNRLAQVKEPGDRLAWYLYDDMGNLEVSRILSASLPPEAQTERRVRYTYTETSRLEEIMVESAGGAGKQEAYQYTDNGLVDQVQQPSGGHINYEYDAMGNVTGLRFAGGGSGGTGQLPANTPQYPSNAPVSKAYDTWGRLTDMTDALGATRYTYDKGGLLVGEQHSEGMDIAYEYDLYGDITAITYPDGNTARYERDELGRVTSLTDRDGGVTAYTYDENGNTLTLTRPDGTITTNTYDALDRISSTQTQDADGAQIESFAYEYDSMSRIVKETAVDAQGLTTERAYAYDEAGMLLHYEETRDGETETREYAYDVFGNMLLEEIQSADGSSLTKGYAYDQNDRLTRIVENGATTASYTYDANGNLVSKQDATGSAAYTYTADNKLATTTVNGRLMSSIVYDGNGMKAFELLRKEIPADVDKGGLDSFIRKHSEEKLIWESEQIPAEKKRISGSAEPVEEAPPEEPPDESRPTPSIWTSTPGNWEKIISSSPMSEQQMKNELLRTHIPASMAASYAPPMGKVLLDFADRLWQDIISAVDSVIDFLYTDGEDVETPGVPETQAGNPFGPKAPEYALDPEYADYVSSEELLRANYLNTSSYAILFEQTGDSITENDYFEPTRYLYNMTEENPQVLSEFGNSAQMRTGYTYGAYAERLSGGRDTLFHYLHDGRGSTSTVVKDGAIDTSYRYDPFGMVVEGAPAQDRIFGFNGEEYTPQTGLIYLRARHYSPQAGRFTTQDTYLGNLTETVTQNRYAYCSNDPVNLIDPSGYASFSLGGSSSASSRSSSQLGKASMSSSKTSSSSSSKTSSSSSLGKSPTGSDIVSTGRGSKEVGGVKQTGTWVTDKNWNTTFVPDSGSSSISIRDGTGSDTSRTITITTYGKGGYTQVEIYIPDRYNPDRNPIAMTITSDYGKDARTVMKFDDIRGSAPQPLSAENNNASNIASSLLQYSNNKNISGYVNYVFYDPGVFTGLFTRKGSFYADKIKDALEFFFEANSNTFLFPVRSKEDFERLWADMGSDYGDILEIGKTPLQKSIKAVILLYHANASTIQLDARTFSENLYEDDIAKLASKSIEYLYLLGCGTAGQQREEFSDNVASTFSQISGVDRVLASDGTVYHKINLGGGYSAYNETADSKNGWVIYENGKIVETYGVNEYSIQDLIGLLIPNIIDL